MKISKLIAQSSFIVVNKDLIRIFGTDAALLLGHLCSLQDYFKDWFYQTYEQIEEETGIKVYSARKAVVLLTEAGVVKTERKGLPCRTYYTIDDAALENIMDLTEESAMTSRAKTIGQGPMKTNDINKIKEIDKKEEEREAVIPFSPIETPNTGLSDRIQATIEYWNELARDHDCIPHYRYNMFQIKDYQGVKRTMGAVTDEEACHAIDTYIEIFENTSDYKCFPNGYSFEGFIKSGVDQYCDSAKPWTRCAIEQGSDPRVKFKSKIWDD